MPSLHFAPASNSAMLTSGNVVAIRSNSGSGSFSDGCKTRFLEPSDQTTGTRTSAMASTSFCAAMTLIRDKRISSPMIQLHIDKTPRESM